MFNFQSPQISFTSLFLILMRPYVASNHTKQHKGEVNNLRL